MLAGRSFTLLFAVNSSQRRPDSASRLSWGRRERGADIFSSSFVCHTCAVHCGRRRSSTLRRMQLDRYGRGEKRELNAFVFLSDVGRLSLSLSRFLTRRVWCPLLLLGAVLEHALFPEIDSWAPGSWLGQLPAARV